MTAAQAASGLTPSWMQVATAIGQKMNAEPMLEPVKVAQVEVSSENTKTIRNGDQPPATPATASPIMALRPESARALATGMTPAIIRMTGAKMLSRNSFQLTTPMSMRAKAHRPGTT